MKKTFFVLLGAFVFSLCFATAAEAKLPRNWSEFKTEFQSAAKTPEGSLNMFFKAVYCYINALEKKDRSQIIDAGKMIRYSIYSNVPIEGSAYYRTFYERLQNKDFHHIFKSYCEDTSVENSYQMDPNNFNLMIERTTNKGEDYTTYWLRSSGADSLRPVGMQLKPDGLWYAVNVNSIYVQVREPKAMVIKHMYDHDPDYDHRR